MARILLAAAAALLLCVPAVNATIVAKRQIGDTTHKIVTYADDGSGEKLLLDDLDLESDVWDIFDVGTSHTGSDVVFSASTPKYGTDYPFGACGRFCYGIYVLADGAVRRISPPAQQCAGFPCVIFEGDPELDPSGNAVFDRYVKLWHACGAQWCASGDGQDSIARRPLAGGSEEAVAIDTGECEAEDPAPHPVTPGLTLFVGCWQGTDGGNVYYASTVDAEGNVANLYFDDFPISDPAWSDDGSLIVDFEGGAGRGLWLSDVAGNGEHVLAVEEADHVESPRFMGDDKLVFIFRRDVWTIDLATCVGAGKPPCTMAQATKLTSTSDVRSLTYTTGSPAPLAEPGAGGSGGTGGGSGAGTPQATPTPSPSPSPSPAPVVTPAPLDAGFALAGPRTLRGLLSGRLGFKLACRCAVKAKLTLGKVVVAKGSGTGAVKLKPTKAAKRKLRRLKRAKLKLKVTAGDRTFVRTLTLRR